MRDLAQKFRRVSFFLKRIRFVGSADDIDLIGDNFPALTFALRGNQFSMHGERRASR